MAAEIVNCQSTKTTEECPPEATRCNKKNLKFMRFSLSMEDTELGEIQETTHPQPELKKKDIEDDCFIRDDELYSLANMSLNLMVNEFDAANSFCNCDKPFNESEIKADSANIACISAEIWKVIQEQKYLFMKTHKECKYITPKQNNICLEETISAKITIFHGTFLGMCPDNKKAGTPVVLNFTDTNNFLCCTDEGEETILTVKVYDRNKLKTSANDPEKSSLIFYMSQKCDGLRHFESALYRGWYIHTVNDEVVKMKKGNNTSSSCFVLERE